MSEPHPPFGINRATASEHGVRVEVLGELDLSTSPQLAEALRREFDGGRSVTLDLSKVTFIDSTGLNVLITSARACEENGCRLALTPDLPTQVRRVFEITGVDGILPLASD